MIFVLVMVFLIDLFVLWLVNMLKVILVVMLRLVKVEVLIFSFGVGVDFVFMDYFFVRCIVEMLDSVMGRVGVVSLMWG